MKTGNLGKKLAFINVQHHNIKTLFLHLKQYQFSWKLAQLLWCTPGNKTVSQWDLTYCWQVFKGVGEEKKSKGEKMPKSIFCRVIKQHLERQQPS